MSYVSKLADFKAILGEVKRMFPESHPVVGGGALRDAYHDRPIKDVDVFLRAKDHPLGLTHPDTRIFVPDFVCNYGLRSDMHGVWNVTRLINGYEVQLILADFENCIDLADTFDIGLSRATFDGSGDWVYHTDKFLQDSHDKAFRIYRADDDGQVARSERRIERLLKKYPNFHYDTTDYIGE